MHLVRERSLRAFLPALAVVAVLGLAPATAMATQETGNPELYSNGVRIGTSKVGQVGWGPIKLVSATLETEIECVNLGFGSANNEGTPAFGSGQLLGWDASGDATSAGGISETSRTCLFTKSGVVGHAEAWATDEPAVETTRKSPLTVPWNVKLQCYEAEAVKHAVVRIGIPNGTAAPTAECPTEAVRGEQITTEETERKGCFATTVPEGCVKVDIIVPALGLEQIFEGTQQPAATNGFTNGLHASEWKFNDPVMLGKLHLKGVFATVGTTTGVVKEIGFGSIQLITAK
jgi:hypothetical protein